MKKFFAKKVRILGKAIPLSAIMLLLVTVVAVGAFLLSMTFQGQLTAQGSPGGTFEEPTCAVIGLGTIDECSKDGHITVNASGLDDDSEVTVAIRFTGANWDGTGSYIRYTEPTIPGVSSLTCIVTDRANVPCDGQEVGRGTGLDMLFTIDLNELVPDQVVDLSWLVEIEDY